ncbi:MAG TPA: DNA ligase D [Polyangia bacterium]|nr:DNA ligase D [Polyangia bacterium]
MPARRGRRSSARASVPAYAAQLATLVEEPPDGEGWLHEQKFDGYRIGAALDAGRARLWSRRGQEWTAELPSVATAVAALPARSALLDGEVAVVLPSGVTSFQALQQRTARTALVYFVFDLLHLDGEDLAPLPLEERKRRLHALVDDRGGVIRYSEHVVGGGAAFHHEACRLGLEGIVSKRRDAVHRAGRNLDWRKIKCGLRQELVVGGFTEPEGARAGVGALLVGYYEGAHLRWAGKVGTGAGWTATFLSDLRRKLERLRTKESPFDPPVADSWLRRHALWVRPALVAEVRFAEWTNEGRVRHASVQGLRADKSPEDVRRERPAVVAPPPARSSRPATAGVEIAGVRISHPDRVVYADLGVTKADLARYYDAVADRMLPHVRDRPLTLLRCARAIDPAHEKGGCTMIKHAKAWGPLPLRRVRIQELHKTGEYLVAVDREGLVSLAQMGVVEIHTWNGHAGAPYEHDRVVFDLDPGPGVAWPRVVAAAHALRELLETRRLRAWVKTTGGKGLHVVVPIAPTSWHACLAFARGVAEAMVRTQPRTYTVALPKAGRADKILVDVLRNGRANTAVAAFSARARAGATVSMPIAWDDLAPSLDPVAFTIASVPGGRRADPWREYWRARQRLPR